MMTLQEIFDKVAGHLLTQKDVSMGYKYRNTNDDGFNIVMRQKCDCDRARCDHFVCMYRGIDGRKCAAGVLIADEFYHPNLEGFGARCDVVREALIKSGACSGSDNDNNIQLIRQLQSLHDSVPHEMWPNALERVAFTWRLEWNFGNGQ